MANAEIELYPILASLAPCIYPSLAIANKELYILKLYPWFHSAPNIYLARSRFAGMLRLRCQTPSPRSAPSSKLPPLDVPVSPISRAGRCKMCPVVLMPTLGCFRPLPPSFLLLASALSCNIIPGYALLFNFNGPYIRIRLVTPQENYNYTESTTTPTDAFVPASTSGRPWAGERWPLCACMHPCPCTHVKIQGRGGPADRSPQWRIRLSSSLV